MPTVFTHAIVGVAAGKLATADRAMPRSFWWLSAGLAMAPDLDVIVLAAGVPYHSMWSHRGISHSLCVAALAGLVAAGLTYRRFGRRYWPLAVCFSAITASHGVLDAFTDGGEGVAFLAPFHPARYFFPWRPVLVAPIGLDFFSEWGLRTVASEMLWIWPPAAAALAAAAGWRTARGRRRPAGMAARPVDPRDV